MERSDVYCTNCGRTFIATMDLSLNGNHEIVCPFCQHVHYRVVRDGVVTEDRWRSSGGPVYTAITSTFTISNTTTMNLSTTTSTLMSSWLNRSDLVLP